MGNVKIRDCPYKLIKTFKMTTDQVNELTELRGLSTPFYAKLGEIMNDTAETSAVRTSAAELQHTIEKFIVDRELSFMRNDK